MEETKSKPVKFFKVRCVSCGAVAWRSLRSRWICKVCGSKKGLIMNLGVDALRERRIDGFLHEGDSK